MSPVFLRVLCLAPLLVGGCAAQQAPGSTAETARLTVVRSSPYTLFRDIKIDGELLAERGAPLPSNVPVPAGVRTIDFAVVLRVGEQCRTVQLICPSAVVESLCSGSFDAQAGVSYAVSADAQGGHVHAVVREARQLSNAMRGRALESTRLTCRRVKSEASIATGSRQE